jgi:hypothetical protein
MRAEPGHEVFTSLFDAGFFSRAKVVKPQNRIIIIAILMSLASAWSAAGADADWTGNGFIRGCRAVLNDRVGDSTVERFKATLRIGAVGGVPRSCRASSTFVRRMPPPIGSRLPS